MKKTMTLTSAACSCALETAKDIRFHGGAKGADLLPESAGYAACRFLRSSSALRGVLVRESYRLRIASAKGRRTVRRSFVAPGPLMELPGAWVRVTLNITAIGVAVTGVYLSEEYPTPSRRKGER
jgi:hypothetical protein